MKQTVYKYIITTLSIFTIWLGGVPILFSKAVPIICENLSYNTPYTIKVEKPRLYTSIIPVFYISAKNIKVCKENAEDCINIQDLSLRLRILPLLTGKIHINSIKASNIDTTTILNDTFTLDKNFLENLKNTNFVCDLVSINNINAKIKHKNSNEIAKFSGKNIIYQKNGRFLKLNADTNLVLGNNSSKANFKLCLPKNNNINNSVIDVNLSNFDLSPIGEYLRAFLPPDTKDIRGIINISVNKEHLAAEFKECAFIRSDDAKSVILPDNLKIKSGFKLSRKTFAIENAELVSKNINTVINGFVNNYLDKTLSDINFDIRLNKSKAEDFVSMMPPLKTEDIDVYKLKKYKFYGDVLGNFSVKGNIKEPSVNGNVYINNVVLTKPIPNAKGATVKLLFKGKYLNFDVTVPAGGMEKVFVLGGVELYNVKYSDMRVWSTPNINLSIAEEKIVPIHEILNFVIGPVPIMDIKGVGNIDIIVKGNRKNPHVWGCLNFRNVITHFYEIPDLILTNADAILTFDDENAVFNLKNGLINGKKTNIDGSCNLAGKFDFDVKATSQELSDLYQVIQTSTMIDDIKMMIPKIDSVQGLSNLVIKVYGSVKDIENIRFNHNVFTKGSLELLGNSIVNNGIKVNDIKGLIKFDKTNADIDVSSKIGKSSINVKAFVKDNYADANIFVNRLKLSDILDSKDKIQQDLFNILVEVSAKYKGKIDNFEYDKLDFTAKILGSEPNNKLEIPSGEISLKNGILQTKNIKGKFIDSNSNFDINLKINDLNSSPSVDGKIKLINFDLPIINILGDISILPSKIKDIVQLVHFEKGKINLNANISNSNIIGSTNIGGVELTYLPKININSDDSEKIVPIPIKVVNGSIYIRKNYLGLNKINIMADNMPLLLDGGINNIFSKPDFNLYINSKPKQDFIDNYFNNNRIYPLKIKGDIVYWLKLKGTQDNYELSSEANLSKDSGIYYLGAFVGDLENSIVLNLNMNVINQNLLRIKEFSYDKLINSQGKRQTRLNMLKANGGIDVYKDDLVFHDLRVKTNNPTDAKIFNILFRKPNIKQGQFTSDLKFNGKLSNPSLLGSFHIVETNIPFMDITMKNLSFVFKDKTIDLSSQGEVLGNELKFRGTFKNKLTLPYYIENAELYTKIIDLNYITDKIKSSHVNETGAFDSFSNFDIKNLVIKNLKLSANEILLRNLKAEKVEANVSITEKKEFNINNFKFNIANGTLDGKFSYNLVNNKTGLILDASNISANDLTIAIFNLNNQIYGDLTGNMKLSCNGSNFNTCMKSLNGSTMFNVSDGRMPKLGSLEYLLKAGNLVKGGVTSLSINSVIDILTPLKTGNFSDIYGTINIKDGVADNIEITTKGKDLSLFISGTYNFDNSDAEMEVLGLLSKKISTMFGPLGNVSLNTLFNVVPGINLANDSKLLDKINKIPGIELNGKSFRKFLAEIKGDINGDNYVSSFKWIN